MSTEAGGINSIPLSKKNLDRADVIGEPIPAVSFRPFIPADARLRELTLLPLIIGTLLGIVFGASSLYLV